MLVTPTHLVKSQVPGAADLVQIRALPLPSSFLICEMGKYHGPPRGCWEDSRKARLFCTVCGVWCLLHDSAGSQGADCQPCLPPLWLPCPFLVSPSLPGSQGKPSTERSLLAAPGPGMAAGMEKLGNPGPVSTTACYDDEKKRKKHDSTASKPSEYKNKTVKRNMLNCKFFSS